MQVLKENVRKNILRRALEEFAEKGFQKASMRRIAINTGFTVGNLYNYFRDKDELFDTVLAPVTEVITRYLDQLEKKDILSSSENWSLEFHMKVASDLSLFLHSNRELLEILLFKSHGSGLETFRDDVIEKYTDLSMLFLQKATIVFPEIRANVSRFAVHNIASFGMTSITELLMHRVPYGEMASCMNEVMTFMYHGWQAVMNCDFSAMNKD